MRIPVLLPLLCAVLVVGACSTPSKPDPVTRGLMEPSFAANLPRSEDHRIALEQSRALQDMTADVLRHSTARGATIGALAGCGMALVTQNASKCVRSAVIGGAAGALTGFEVGKTRINNRVELVSLSRLMPSVAQAQDQVEALGASLPNTLAQQEGHIAAMSDALASGAIDQATYDVEVSKIQNYRQDLVASLSLSAAQAAQARAELNKAQSEGQVGLSWYLHATERLEDEAIMARNSVDLL